MTTSLQSTPREPPFPRAAEIDECVADASSRVKRLHGLLTQWQLADMSQEQSSHLLAYVEEVLQHTRESSSALHASSTPPCWQKWVQSRLPGRASA